VYEQKLSINPIASFSNRAGRESLTEGNGRPSRRRRQTRRIPQDNGEARKVVQRIVCSPEM